MVRLICPKCGHIRFVQQRYYHTKDMCPRCRRNERLGRTCSIITNGYKFVRIPKHNKFYSMCNTNGYCAEHRYIMAQYLNRCLTEDEIVHHINGKKKDNRIENLELVTRGTHRMSYSSAYKDGFDEGYEKGFNEGYDEGKKMERYKGRV